MFQYSWEIFVCSFWKSFSKARNTLYAFRLARIQCIMLFSLIIHKLGMHDFFFYFFEDYLGNISNVQKATIKHVNRRFKTGQVIGTRFFSQHIIKILHCKISTLRWRFRIETSRSVPTTFDPSGSGSEECRPPSHSLRRWQFRCMCRSAPASRCQFAGRSRQDRLRRRGGKNP